MYVVYIGTDTPTYSILFHFKNLSSLAKTVSVEVNNIAKSKDTSSFKHFLLDDFWLLATGWTVQG